MNLRRLLALVSILFIAPAAYAGDFDRRGFYLGANGVAGVDLFSKAIENAVQDTLLLPVSVDVDPAAGFNVRVGYRLFSWFAMEANYEYINGFDTNVEFAGVDVVTAESKFHTVTGNVKFLRPPGESSPTCCWGSADSTATRSSTRRFPGSCPSWARSTTSPGLSRADPPSASISTSRRTS